MSTIDFPYDVSAQEQYSPDGGNEVTQDREVSHADTNIPRTHGLHLAVDVNVGEAWDQFFDVCWDFWDVVVKRRAAANKSCPDGNISSNPLPDSS